MDKITRQKVLKLLDENQQLLKELRVDMLNMLEDTKCMRKKLKDINNNLEDYRK